VFDEPGALGLTFGAPSHPGDAKSLGVWFDKDSQWVQNFFFVRTQNKFLLVLTVDAKSQAENKVYSRAAQF
jgi:hypothetical protein